MVPWYFILVTQQTKSTINKVSQRTSPTRALSFWLAHTQTIHSTGPRHSPHHFGMEQTYTHRPRGFLSTKLCHLLPPPSLPFRGRGKMAGLRKETKRIAIFWLRLVSLDKHGDNKDYCWREALAFMETGDWIGQKKATDQVRQGIEVKMNGPFHFHRTTLKELEKWFKKCHFPRYHLI